MPGSPTPPPLERTQTGVRLHSPLLKVLKALADYKDMSLGDLLEGMALHGLENRPAFSPETLEVIAKLRDVYGLTLTAADSHTHPDPEDAPPQPTLYSEADLARIAGGLIERTLPRADWTHAAHWAAALYILARRPDIDAPARMPEIISGYNVAVGGVNSDSEGYHETITQAALRGARAFLSAAPAGEPLSLTHARLMASDMGRRDWQLSWWSKETLFSVAARKGWVEPDLAPFPYPPLPAGPLPAGPLPAGPIPTGAVPPAAGVE
ncbi:MAG: hypothetical protein R3C52_15690 [Hyphomonadaceae bacterium]